MHIWVALIVAPLLALTDQFAVFALAHWACAHQGTWVVHVSHGIFLAMVAAAAGGAWSQWRATALPAGVSEPRAPFHFLTGVAMMVAVLSAVAIIAMWIPTWMISACTA